MVLCLLHVKVVGVPDVRLGEQVCCWIKLKDGQTATADEIKEFCKDKVRYAIINSSILYLE